MQANHLLNKKPVLQPLGCSQQPRQLRSTRSFASCGSSPTGITLDGQWLGSDSFTQLNDRVDAAPLPLPNITRPVRVCLVRHGQSTWNAEGRIQGSSDLSVLSPKGIVQAGAARDMLAPLPVTAVFHSPLARAAQTARAICEGRAVPATQLPALREVDLYGFQGLIKAEGKARYGAQYLQWQKRPAQFEIDGHAPVRELWYRASLAWQQILTQTASSQPTQQQQQQQQQSPAVCTPDALTTSAPSDEPDDSGLLLVVAHNAVNQALICTALGLGPGSFRAITQANAAVTMLQLTPGTAAPPPSGSVAGSSGAAGGAAASCGQAVVQPGVQLLCLNQTSVEVLKVEDEVSARVILLCCDGVSQAGNTSAAVTRLAQLLSAMQVHAVAGPSHLHPVAQQLTQLLPSPVPFTPLPPSTAHSAPTTNTDGLPHPPSSPGSSSSSSSGTSCESSWSEVCSMAAHMGGQNVVILLHAASASDLICSALKLGNVVHSTHETSTSSSDSNAAASPGVAAHAGAAVSGSQAHGSAVLLPFCMSPGSIAVVKFSGDPVSTPAVLHCILMPGLGAPLA
ncbi:MAG: hypothetical protein WDW38_007929 [Sanguina aurantia]